MEKITIASMKGIAIKTAEKVAKLLYFSLSFSS
jgi:hypothetical protein